MILQSLVTLFVAQAMRAGYLIRNMMPLALLLAFAIPVHHASAAAGGVYVAGKGTNLEQTLKQAIADNPGKSVPPFWIVIAGSEVSHVKNGANISIQGGIKSVRERGGLVYVCRSDMIRAGIKEGDLLEGVTAMYGYDPKDWAGLLPARREGIRLPDNMSQSQLILKTCAGENSKPAS